MGKPRIFIATPNLGEISTKREVMEKVKRPAFMFTQTDQWGIEGLSEDIFFAERVVDAGFDEYNDYGVLCDHMIRMDTRVLNTFLIGVGNE